MPGDENAVLSANAAFYQAFDRHDVAAMEKLWARDCPVACIHPGWAPLHGRAPVLESFGSILGGPSPPSIACLGARAYVHDTIAFVICNERLEDAELVATNIFVRESDGWKLIHHQAGPTPPRPDPPAGGTVH